MFNRNGARPHAQLSAVALLFCVGPVFAQVHPDFNGDGHADLVIGSGGAFSREGLVQVVLDSDTGLMASPVTTLYQDLEGVDGVASPSDCFGSAIATGDFNADGLDDLVVGIWGKEVGGIQNAGCIQVFQSWPQGPMAHDSKIWDQGSPGMPGAVQKDAAFGADLASGDFDADGFDDLAIGVYRQKVDGVSRAGAVVVMYGSGNGLRTAGAQLITQDTPHVPSEVRFRNEFGSELVRGDFNGDGFDDLAISSQSDKVAGEYPGTVTVVFGSATGIRGVGSRRFHAYNLPAGTAGNYDFGRSLASGDFNDDGFDDLVVASPLNDGAKGRVTVIPGAADGFSDDAAYAYEPNPAHGTFVGETGNTAHSFGAGLATGDFDADGFDDLAIGASKQKVGNGGFAGRVHVYFGGIAGLDPASLVNLTQNSIPGSDTAEAGDVFGGGMSAADFDGDGATDLVISARDDIDDVEDSGAVSILKGSPAGFILPLAQFWTQPTLGRPLQTREYFGSSLSH